MRAVRLRTDGSGWGEVQVPIPAPGPGEVLLQIDYTGLCHTDLHFIDGENAARMPAEVTLGHEAGGVVRDVGEGVPHWQSGDRAIVHPVDEKNGETWVLGVHFDGSWAEYLLVPAHLLVASDGVPPEQAALLPDAVATPWAAITSTAQVRPGEAVAVWGLGGLGYHAVKLLRLVGAVPIIALDPQPEARERALRAGADVALDPMGERWHEELEEALAGRALDVAFDFFGGSAVQQQAFDAVRRGGRIVLTGIPDAPLHLDSSPQLIRLQKRILGHYGTERHHLVELVEMVRRGRLDLADSVSEVLPLAEVDTAVSHLRTQFQNPVRILLQP